MFRAWKCRLTLGLALLRGMIWINVRDPLYFFWMYGIQGLRFLPFLWFRDLGFRVHTLCGFKDLGFWVSAFGGLGIQGLGLRNIGFRV